MLTARGRVVTNGHLVGTARLAVSQKPSSSQARLRPTKQGLLTVGWRKFEFQTRVPAGAAFRKNGPLVNAPFTAFILRMRTRANRANREGSVKTFPGTNALPAAQDSLRHV